MMAQLGQIYKVEFIAETVGKRRSLQHKGFGAILACVPTIGKGFSAAKPAEIVAAQGFRGYDVCVGSFGMKKPSLLGPGSLGRFLAG